VLRFNSVIQLLSCTYTKQNTFISAVISGHNYCSLIVAVLAVEVLAVIYLGYL